MKKERIKQTKQKYKESVETIMSNSKSIKWTTQKKWTFLEKFNI